MRKNIFLFNLILSMLISLNYNMAYSEPKENTKQNEEIESQPYKTLEELKKELKEERRQIDQQRLEEIRKREQEKREELGEPENTDKNDNEKKKSEEKKNKENEYIPSLIVRLRGKHSTKYLCSYHFVIENDNTESELDKTNFDDYNQLLKKTSLKVRAGEVVNFEFSEKPIKVRAYIWDDEIKELKMNRGTIKVPQLDKKIVVGVEGTYKNGKILYAVVLDVRG